MEPSISSIPQGLPQDFVKTGRDGLTKDQVRERMEKGLQNHPGKDPGKTVGRIIAGNLFTLFNLLNVALAVSLIAVGSYRNLLFMGVVVSNTLIGTVQELRARRTFQKLKLLSQAKVRVIREGREEAAAPSELVKDDLVLLRAGDQVAADAIVIEGQAALNESLLTGESDPVDKKEGDWLLSGSFLTEGAVTAQLLRVGEESYAASLVKSAKAIRSPHSELMSSLQKLIRFVSIVLVPLGIALFLKQVFVLRQPMNEAVPATVAAVLGMIPEGLMLLTSVALAVGVIRLGKRNTLVQELYGIESLARVDTLCLDKTGTITMGRMALEKVIPLKDMEEAELRQRIGAFAFAFQDDTPTLNALRAACPQRDNLKPLGVIPFSSQRKWSAVSFHQEETWAAGAPEFLLSQEERAPFQELIEEAAAQGFRVLALVRAEGTIREKNRLPGPKEPMAILCLSDVVRKEAPDTLRFFREQGVTVKVISGDNPVTVSQVARRAGLEDWENLVDAATLKTKEALESAAERYTVFGRVTPQQKRELVEALKGRGHTVAMTGDGVNDIPALKASDCSIAMAGGADAVKHAAQLTLLDANFAAMPQIVLEGRRVINNITRAASLFLVKTNFSFLLSALLLFVRMPYPFQPIQLTLISSLTVGIPSFFLALEPNKARVQGNFLKNVFKNALPGALTIVIAVALAFIVSGPLMLSEDQVSTLCTLAAGWCGLVVLFLVCQPLDWKRAILLFTMAAAFATAALAFGRVFFLAALPAGGVWALAGLFVLIPLSIWGFRAIMNKVMR